MIRQKPPPDARILKMRDIEEKLCKMKVFTEADKKVGQVALWEERTSEKIRRSVIQQRLDALKYRREQDVNARRQQLSVLLSTEDARLKQELIMSQETPEQRRSKLAERAKGLALTREMERQALSNSLQQRAFEESCVPLREVNSKRALARTVEERNQQIEEHMTQKLLEAGEKVQWHELNEIERQKKEGRYLSDVQRRQDARALMVRQLDDQVAQLQAQRTQEADARAQEVADLQALWREMAAEQGQRDREEKERLKRLSDELFEFNRLKQLHLSDADRREKEQDLKILQDALAKEAGDEAKEAADRERRRQEMQLYRQQLTQMMGRQAEETAERDALVFKAHLEQEAKEDADRFARDEARRKLMEQVDAIRQLQIAEKQARKQAELDEKRFDRQMMAEEAETQRVTDTVRRGEANKAALTRRLEVQTQVVAKAHRRAAEEGEKQRVAEQQRAVEESYLWHVSDTIQATEAPKWFGRKKFDW